MECTRLHSSKKIDKDQSRLADPLRSYSEIEADLNLENFDLYRSTQENIDHYRSTQIFSDLLIREYESANYIPSFVAVLCATLIVIPLSRACHPAQLRWVMQMNSKDLGCNWFKCRAVQAHGEVWCSLVCHHKFGHARKWIQQFKIQ